MVIPGKYLRAFNVTSIGASHIRAGKPCQDFSASRMGGKIAIAALADGHGGEEYTRSDWGARFAVEAAMENVKEFMLSQKNILPAPDSGLQELEKSIIAEWHNKVDRDLKSRPGSGTDKSPDTHSYGTTLIAAAVTGSYWFALQIGDGKCVAIGKNNIPWQPVPWDERCFLNRTTSLCDDDAAKRFRHYYSEEVPRAVFMGSDGIDDSFPINENATHLGGFYMAIFNNFIKEGMKEGEKQLGEMMPKLTRKGSGDDVSIAGIIRNIKS